MARVFLSYARADFDSDLTKVVDKLKDELARAITGADPTTLLFRDAQSINLGEKWGPALTNAIAGCDVFIALFSPRYFASDYCGREWAAFMARIDASANQTSASRRFIPIWWTPLEDSNVKLPGRVAGRQHTVADLGDDYLNLGLRNLKMTKSAPAYNRVRIALARLINSTLNGADIAALGPGNAATPIENYDNAFLPRPTPAAAPDAAPPAADGNGTRRKVPKRVWFAIAAGVLADMKDRRKNLSPYDEEDALSWRPYDVQNALFKDLSEAATQENLAPEFDELAADLAGQLTARELQPAIVVADPWSVDLDRYRAAVKILRNHPAVANLGTIVPWPEDDGEPPDVRAARVELLRDALGPRMVVDQEAFCHPLSSQKEVVPAVRKLIVTLRQRIIRLLPPPGGGGDFPNRARLSGPGGR